MKIYINKKETEVADGASLKQVIDGIENLPKVGYAVALNSDLALKDTWETTTLCDGDKITIITAFYGG